jgi:hypothetical protein
LKEIRGNAKVANNTRKRSAKNADKLQLEGKWLDVCIIYLIFLKLIKGK